MNFQEDQDFQEGKDFQNMFNEFIDDIEAYLEEYRNTVNISVYYRRNFRGVYQLVNPHPTRIRKMRRFEIEIPETNRPYLIRIYMRRIAETGFPNSSFPKMSFTENNFLVARPEYQTYQRDSQIYPGDVRNTVNLYLSTESTNHRAQRGNDTYSFSIFIVFSETEIQEIYNVEFSPVKNKNFEPSNVLLNSFLALKLQVQLEY